VDNHANIRSFIATAYKLPNMLEMRVPCPLLKLAESKYYFAIQASTHLIKRKSMH